MTEAEAKENTPQLDPEPVEITQRRIDIAVRLEKEALAATGPLQTVLIRMRDLVVSTHASIAVPPTLYRDVSDAFMTFVQAAKDQNPTPVFPPIVAEANDFVLTHASSLSGRLEKAGVKLNDTAKEQLAALQAARNSVVRTKSEPSAPAPQVDAPAKVTPPVAAQPPAAQPPKETPKEPKPFVNPTLGHIK